MHPVPMHQLYMQHVCCVTEGAHLPASLHLCMDSLVSVYDSSEDSECEDSVDLLSSTDSKAYQAHTDVGQAATAAAGGAAAAEPQGLDTAAPAFGASQKRGRADTGWEEDTWTPPTLQASAVAKTGQFSPGVALPDGRVRAFPRIEGEYPTTVMIPVYLTDAAEAQRQILVKQLQVRMPDLQPLQPLSVSSNKHDSRTPPCLSSTSSAGVHAVQAPSTSTIGHHISLSRTVPIRSPQIDTLVTELRHSMRKQPRLGITLQGLKVFTNDNKSRTFLAIPVTAGAAEVCAAIKCVDRAFALHCLPVYYEVPEPHLSLAWVLGDKKEQLEAVIGQLRPMPLQDDSAVSCGFECELAPENCVCQIGSKEYVVWSAARS